MYPKPQDDALVGFYNVDGDLIGRFSGQVFVLYLNSDEQTETTCPDRE